MPPLAERRRCLHSQNVAALSRADPCWIRQGGHTVRQERTSALSVAPARAQMAMIQPHFIRQCRLAKLIMVCEFCLLGTPGCGRGERGLVPAAALSSLSESTRKGAARGGFCNFASPASFRTPAHQLVPGVRWSRPATGQWPCFCDISTFDEAVTRRNAVPFVTYIT